MTINDLFVLVFFATSPMAFSQEKVPKNSSDAAEVVTATGIVGNVGSAISAHTVLTPKGERRGQKLCRSDMARSISRITGMTVTAHGSWKLNKKGRKKCLRVQSFTVDKTSSGRDAVVGILSKESDGSFKVTTDQGKTYAFSRIPNGLKSMEGKKVILDVKTFSTPNALDSGKKVVTYSQFPAN